MNNLKSLAQRCEDAPAPDRVLNTFVHEACGLSFEMEYFTENDPTMSRNLSKVPHYTGSVDAALRLATGLEKGCGDGQEFTREALTRLNKRFNLHMSFWPDEENFTEWLARYITAAALRARDSEEEQ